jgi:phytoene dehydrogenase-like protein
MLWQDPFRTAEGFAKDIPADGPAWLRLHGLWRRIGSDLVDALLSPFPPFRPAGRIASTLGVGGSLRLARFLSLPVRRLIEEEFRGDGPGLLLAGCALHADFFPESSGSALFGWLLAMLGHHAGYPVVQGGAEQLTAALVRRLESRGGRVDCSRQVTHIDVRAGSVSGVRTADGDRVEVRRAVLADVAVTELYGALVSRDDLPATLVDDLRRFQWDWSTVKFDWGLSQPVPWSCPDLSSSGTIHMADSLDSLTRGSAALATGMVPADPFVLLGQLTTSDPTRSPPGTECLYGYTHVPRQVQGDSGDGSIKGVWDQDDLDALADRVEDRIERHAPGFRARIRARHILGPAGLQGHDPNLDWGSINGGTAAIHQQLVFRPIPGLGRAETPVNGLYLSSASAHPGGGVHGACGANAARAALAASRPLHKLTLGPAGRAVQGRTRGRTLLQD